MMQHLNLEDSTNSQDSSVESLSQDETQLESQPTQEIQQGNTLMSRTKQPSRNLIIAFVACAIGFGALTGFGAHRLVNAGSSTSGGAKTADGQPLTATPQGSVSNGDIFGDPNTELFKDNATGYLEEGGIDGEGSHKLLRPGGVSQTVYLTSSITDLDEFVGMEIKVAGETFKGQKAGWLMDVGQVEVLNTEAEAPIQ